MRLRLPAVCFSWLLLVGAAVPLPGVRAAPTSVRPQAGEARRAVPGNDVARGASLQSHTATYLIVDRGTQSERGTVSIELNAATRGEGETWRFRLEMDGDVPDAAGVLGPHLRAPELPLVVQAELGRQTLVAVAGVLDSAGRRRSLTDEQPSFALVYYLLAAALPLEAGAAFAFPQPEGEAVIVVGARETIEIEGFGNVEVWPVEYSASAGEEPIGQFWLGDEPPYLMHAHMGQQTHWALQSFELRPPVPR